MAEPPRELVRTTLGVLFIGALIVASFWVMRPFIAATIWATMIVVSTWPVLKWFEARLWRRRSLAVLVMTLLLLLVLVVPLMLAIATIVGHADDIVGQGLGAGALQVPPPPEWVKGLPFIGDKRLSSGRRPCWPARRACSPSSRPTPTTSGAGSWRRPAASASVFVQFLLTVVISAVMYSGGEIGGPGGAPLRPAPGRRAAARTP